MKYFLSLLCCLTLQANLLSNTPIEPDELIRRWVESKTFKVDNEIIHCSKTLPEFYLDRGFEPAWEDYDNIEELIAQIKLTEDDGLNPEDYHLSYLVEHYQNKKEVTPFTDIVLTDAYFLLTSHLLNGKVNPETLDAEWRINKKESNFKDMLTQSLAENLVAYNINQIKPKFSIYKHLKTALKYYKNYDSNAKWVSITNGEAIKEGKSDERIPAIKSRLIALGATFTSNAEDSLKYDDDIIAAIKKFQTANGLAADGVIGNETINMLNLSPEQKVTTIKANLERCRWLPQELGNHYIMVNIADFQLTAIKNNDTTLTMNVVVGKPYRKTPVFSEKMRYLVLNPYWTVPPTILSQDILPALKKNSNYLKKLNINVVDGEKIIDPASIEWSKMTARNFPYQLRQDPGENNALGIVKFIFPNPYNVYMHDTNHRELFGNTDRALSSGCIRLSQPKQMAYYVLQNDATWNKDKIDLTIKTAKNVTVILKENIMVHIMYWTAFSKNNTIQFRKDIYNRDKTLWEALMQAPPSI